MARYGEPAQKEKLSFVSLARQIEGAIKKVYKSSEVVDNTGRVFEASSGYQNQQWISDQ